MLSAMNETIAVNFHCHSVFSDGEQTPEALAANLAAARVRHAALTDHDTLEGQARFQDAAKKRGVACLTGVEITADFNGREAHLLGYGFDPGHPELLATLLALRHAREQEVQSIAGSLRKMAAARPGASSAAPAVSAAPDGRLAIGEAIALLHRAGGKAFLAHPLTYEPDPQRLADDLMALKRLGLDGLEAIYAPYSEVQRAALSALAGEQDLLISAGADIHAANGAADVSYAVEMPRADWLSFRAAVFAGPTFAAETCAAPSDAPPASHQQPAGSGRRRQLRSYIIRIFLPTLVAIALLLTAIWGVTLPSFEKTLLERKRELIRELTNSAWSILASYERDERLGVLTREQAQAAAIQRIEALRYGPEGKDYFWIQDLQPRMIMHPYRSDLNGQDLSAVADSRGVSIFVEFANLVRRENEGYIDYVWQWKDDPQRLAPKESYIKGFAPWNWVIGTGIYTDDVRTEIARIERSIFNTSLIISGAIVVLLLFVLQQTLRIERQRQDIVDTLRESTERYHTLIETATEGALLILDERCRYANPIFLDMTGYTSRQLDFLELADLLPRDGSNAAIWAHVERMECEQPDPGETFEAVLRHADGHFVECVVDLNPIALAGQKGLILLARDVQRQQAARPEDCALHAAQTAPIGIFRARAARRAALIEMNATARAMLAPFAGPQPALGDLFSDPAEFESVFQTLQTAGVIADHVIHIETSDAAARFLSLSAQWVRDESAHTAYIDGILVDVTTSRKREAGREALIEKYQASLLFLHQPLATLGRDIVVCHMSATVEQVSRQMTMRNVSAALVAGDNDVIIGIITDRDLRSRVLAERIPPHAPIHTVMSAPVTKIPESALLYEALMRMEEKGVRHLAVTDPSGQIVSVIDSQALIQFQRYGPIVLAREIARSGSPHEVAQCVERARPLAKTLLDSSARTRHVTGMLASVCDAATEKLIQLAIEQLGPPPAPFSFIAMGSQGRQEQTLVTDQDNGIIFAPSAGADLSLVNDYFLRLGQRVCDGLSLAGYQYCRGGVMANNPRWCRSLSDWVAGFDAWIRQSEPQEIIDLVIFFDFRTVYGDAELTHALRRAMHASLAEAPASFHHFAHNAQTFRPPFRLLGNIYLSGGTSEHAGDINLKDAMMPIVGFARLYALRHHLDQTNTLERVEALADKRVLSASSRDEILAAYEFLMQLRLQNQIAAIEANRSPVNVIHPGRLGHIQQELLKQAFAQIAAVQKKISYDFLGGA
jgi:PAS domain S-box-containing protein